MNEQNFMALFLLVTFLVVILYKPVVEKVFIEAHTDRVFYL